MTTLRKALLLTLLAAFVGLPLAAQGTDCSFTRTFTGNLTAVSSSNISNATPCVNWRVTLSTTGTLSSTVEFQISPDNVTFTAVPSSICSASVQPPCVLAGTQPIVGTQGMMLVAAYGSYVRVVITSSSGTGTGTIRGYGAKGATASSLPSSGSGGGSGTVTSVGFTGGLISVANPTTAPAFTVAGTSGGIPYFASASTWASSALLTATYAILGGGAGNPPISSTILNNSATGIGIGTVTSTYFLDVSGGVGLTGTARFFDQTATTGSTLVTITPGAAQANTSTVLSVGGAQSLSGALVLTGTSGNTAAIESYTSAVINIFNGYPMGSFNFQTNGGLFQFSRYIDNALLFSVSDSSGVVAVSSIGVLQQLPRTTDPTCATVGDIGKFWFNNTTTTTAPKKCVNVVGTLTWVAF